MSGLGELASLSSADLHAEWRRSYRTAPPRISRDLLVRALAHKRQEQAHGGLDAATARKLKRLVQQVEKGGSRSGVTDATITSAAAAAAVHGSTSSPSLSHAPTLPPPPAAASLAPGTRLVREWGGRTHVVEVVTAPSGTSTAFVHGGRIHSSLSEVARVITGARWSGPRFFGLVQRKAERRDAA